MDGADSTDDMNCLSDLTEGSLLRNLKIRYDNNQIYVMKILFLNIGIKLILATMPQG